MKSLLFKPTLLVLLCALSGSLIAQDTSGINNYQDNTSTMSKATDPDIFSTKTFRTWSIGLQGGVLSPYTIFRGKTNDFDNPTEAWGYGGFIGKQITPAFGLKAEFLAGSVEGSKASTLKGTPQYDGSKFRSHIKWSGALTANLTVASLNFNRINSYFAPYIKAGAGIMSSDAVLTNLSPDRASDEDWFIPVGVGLKIGLSKGLNIDLGYDVNFTKMSDFDGVSSGTYDKFSYGHFGLEFALGKKGRPQLSNFSPVAALRQANAEQTRQLNTAMLKAEQDAQNMRNQYSTMISQYTADQAQLAKDLADDDRDGVANKFDKCPGTSADSTVDGSGCPFVVKPQVIKETQVVVTEDDRRVIDEAIKNLEFDLGKATLRPRSYESLNRVAEILKEKSFSLKLAGHTDNTGPMALNLRLSKDRAESVKAYLVSQGANPSRIEAVGYGPNQPIATNKTEEGRQQNRRVEFTLY